METTTKSGRLTIVVTVLLSILPACGAAGATEQSLYKSPPLFSTAPSEKASLQAIDRFGPIGLGIELHQPAFVMKIKNIEPGSPAAASGMLKKRPSHRDD